MPITARGITNPSFYTKIWSGMRKPRMEGGFYLRDLENIYNTPERPAAKSCGRIVGNRYTPLSIAVALLIAWK